MEFINPQKVLISNSRWNVVVHVVDENGETHSYIASADSAVAESGIYFATKEEYEEDIERWN